MQPAALKKTEAVILSAVCTSISPRVPSIPARQLELLCAPWAHYFTHTLWHRLERHLASNREVHGSAAKIAAPGDTLSFMELSRTAEYPVYLDATLSGEEATFSCRLGSNLLDFAGLPRGPVTLGFQTCLPSGFRHLLRWTSLGKIHFLDDRPHRKTIALDPEARQKLAGHLSTALSFLPADQATWLSLRAQELFPRSLLEYLPRRLRELSHLPARQMLFSANGWPLIDDWKIYALAQKAKNGTRLIGTPHAISHGCLADFWQREFELAHLDSYLSWGWSAPSPLVISFYTPYFAGQAPGRPRRHDSEPSVLISSAGRPCHLLEYPYTPERFEHYLATQLQLASLVQQHTGMKVAIRTRPRDLGWDLPQMVAALNNSMVKLEFQEGKFLQRLRKSRLHICDNCSTTIVESLFANHPTLVLITDDYFRITPEAAVDFDILAQAGIFHATLPSLMKQLGQIQTDIDYWWMAKSTQSAVRAFLHRQGQAGSSLGTWRRALLGTLQT